MKATTKMLHFKEMNDLYEHIGLQVRSFNRELHIYQFEDFDANCVRAMPPHTKDFYQVSYITNYGNSQQEINTQAVQPVRSIFYFIAPEHTYSWKRDETISGYILNFKAEGLPIPMTEFLTKFQFFDLNQSNILLVDANGEQRLVQLFAQLYEAYYRPQKRYSKSLLQHWLLVLLYSCLNAYQDQQSNFQTLPIDQQIFIRYKNLINQYYLDKRTLAEYADLLQVSTNYLSTTVKKASGKSAATFITNRLALEAKNLLKFSELSIKEIAYSLNFSDPSHFGKFFKKMIRLTPLAYRNQSDPRDRP